MEKHVLVYYGRLSTVYMYLTTIVFNFVQRQDFWRIGLIYDHPGKSLLGDSIDYNVQMYEQFMVLTPLLRNT